MEEFSKICIEVKEEVKILEERIKLFTKRENILSIYGVVDGLILDNELEHVVKNISLFNRLKNQLLEIIFFLEPTEEFKKTINSYYILTALQSKYWRESEKVFTPVVLLRQIKIQAINDTIIGLTKAGIGIGYEASIVEILNKSITTGGSYSTFAKHLLISLQEKKQAETKSEISNLKQLAAQIVSDSLTQYNAHYNQLTSSDLGYEWFKYDNSLLTDSRSFCRAMCRQPYFHISEIPKILKAENLIYETDDGEKEYVQLNEESGFPEGMFLNSSISMFFIYRGGVNCGHQIRPVSERQVPVEIKEKVCQTIGYKAFKKSF